MSEGTLVVGSINPEPKYFQVASTANNRDEWATYFVDILPECDSDNDGIPNRLDLDSDNDGCLDALEGGATFQLSSITTSAGTVTVGPGSSATGGNLCAGPGCVDINGMPTTVGNTGQTPVETYNPAVISEVCQNALPVTLTAFNAYKAETSVLLKWSTTSEQNNQVFEIEHSINGKNWKNIGSVSPNTPNGSSNSLQHYSFTDANPTSNRNYYRLKQIDLDNTFAYSSIRTIWVDNSKIIKAYPNPISDRVMLNGLQNGYTIDLYNAAGLHLQNTKASGNSIKALDLSKYTPGFYTLVIRDTSGNMISTHKMIKTN